MSTSEPYEPSLADLADDVKELLARVDWLIAQQNELKQSMQKMLTEIKTKKIENGEIDLF